MKIIGREKLDKWKKEKIAKKRYGFSITKTRLHKTLQGLNPYEKVVYINLWLYADREGHCWPSMRHQAKDLGLAVMTIQKHIQTLKKKRFLKIKTKKGKGGKRFEYWLLKW